MVKFRLNIYFDQNTEGNFKEVEHSLNRLPNQEKKQAIDKQDWKVD